jgi:hypothetical protein
MRFSKALVVAGMLAGPVLGLCGCGPDYAIFKVNVTSTTSPRNNIEECRLTITDENGHLVLDKYSLDPVYGPLDSAGNQTLDQGCAAPLTKANIGVLSYSSSRTSGTLTFRVDAWDNKGQQCGYTCTPVQTGSSDAKPVAYPPEISVSVVIK